MALLRMQQQTLSASLGAAIVIPSGWENLSIELDDPSKALTVEIDGTYDFGGDASSWSLETPGGSTSNSISVKMKADTGTPVATVIWFQ